MEAKTLLQQLIDEKVIDRNYRHNLYDAQQQGSWIFDFRTILLRPECLTLVTDLLWEEIKDLDHYQIGGMESASIPLVTNLLLKAQNGGKTVNGFYVRKSRKKSGLYKHIEGELNNDPVVLVDDIINTAGSFTRQVTVLEALEKKVERIVAIIRYREMDAYAHLTDRGIDIRNLFTLDDFDIVEDFSSRKQPKQNPYRLLWHIPSDISSYNIVGPRSTPVVAGDLVLFGTDAGYFRAVDKHTGKERWHLRMGRHSEHKSILSSPCVHKDTVFFGSYDGKVYALNVQTGEPKWVFTDCEWVGSSPCVAPDLGLVFVGLEHALPTRRGSMVALNIETGEKVWEFDMRALTHASPLYLKEHKQVCFGGNEGVVYMVDATTGELVWKFETEGGRYYAGIGGFSPGDIKSAPVYDADTDQVAFCSLDGCMYVLKRESGELVFRAHTDYVDTSIRSWIFGQPLFTKDAVYFAGVDKYCYCHDKRTGEFRWKFRTAGRIFATPVAHGESIFIGSNDGRLYELDAHNGTAKTVTQFVERITTPVVVDQDTQTLFVTTNTNEVFAFGLT